MKRLGLKSLKAKLLVIFIVPSLAFGYFFYLYIQKEYSTQNTISQYKYSIKVISKVSSLIHTLQIERGLSAGYIIVKKNKEIKSKLLHQYKITDEAYKNIVSIMKSRYFLKNIDQTNQHILYQAIHSLQNMKQMRSDVLNSSVSFEKEIEYYSAINEKLIVLIKNLNAQFTKFHHDNNTIDYFLQIQEYAGLERAYTYNLLLSGVKKNEILWHIKELVHQREKIQENLLMSASRSSIAIYKKFYKKEIEAHFQYCFQEIAKGQFKKVSAHQCFEASTRYINMLNTIYETILKHYVQQVDSISKKSLQHLYTALSVGVLSVIIIVILLYILIQLIINEEKNKFDLQIAAYTFEAQEGVVITDVTGKILKVNRSFTVITGYTLDEVQGQTPRILKSNKHPESFYAEIWEALYTKGQWQGEIINRRKSGEYYDEMLSITAIKNEEGEITHFIGQFLDISEIKEAQIALQYQVDHDFLTGLFSRKALEQRLHEEYSKAKRHNLQHAFLFIDLDHFKSINDTYGHAIGDQVLIAVAKRLKSILREEDIVARISGDEFGVLVTNLPLDSLKAFCELEHIATKILQNVSQEIACETCTLKISLSIGIKLFPTTNTGFEEIIINADKAMYKAKQRGKNQYVFYTG